MVKPWPRRRPRREPRLRTDHTKANSTPTQIMLASSQDPQLGLSAWEARMTKSKMLAALIAVGAVILTSAVTPASAARRHAAWRGAAIAAGVGAGLAAAAAASTYYSGYGYGRYGSYGYGHSGRCGGGAYHRLVSSAHRDPTETAVARSVTGATTKQSARTS
jgi:hypothetical protein